MHITKPVAVKLRCHATALINFYLLLMQLVLCRVEAGKNYQNYSIFFSGTFRRVLRVTEEDSISETEVWPIISSLLLKELTFICVDCLVKVSKLQYFSQALFAEF